MESTKPDEQVAAVERLIIDDKEGDEVTPFNIQAQSETGIDYDKLVDKFGCSRMTDELREKI